MFLTFIFHIFVKYLITIPNSRRKFRSANEVYLHACAEHCPDNIDPNADIYCQWGPGPNLCDNLPRKRFSLMTHINDRHITLDSFKAAVQRRIAAGPQISVTQAVTIIKKPLATTSDAIGAASPTLSTSSTSSTAGSSAAIQAIKRHTMDLVNPKELLVCTYYMLCYSALLIIMYYSVCFEIFKS